MEYEIDDDPQGLPDPLEARRDGGLKDGHLFFRKGLPATSDDSLDEDLDIRQLGEVA